MTRKAKPSPSLPDFPASAVESVPVDQLTPYARNARTHTDAQIEMVAASIREFGFTVPILRDESGTVLAGHARLAAAKRVGLTAVPVVTARGWSEAKRRAYVLADNQLQIAGSDWDEDLLKLELAELQSSDEELLELLGFDEDLDRFLGQLDEDDEEDEPSAEPIQRPAAQPSGQDAPVYKPTLDPSVGSREYTDADMQRGNDRLQAQFKQPQTEPYRVVCPHCAAEFYFDV